MTACERFGEELLAYHDRELPEPGRRDLEVHLESCTACRRELESLEALDRSIRDLPRVEPSAQWEQQLRDRLGLDSGAAVGAAPPVPRDASARRARARPRGAPRRVSMRVAWGVAGLAAAAACALLIVRSAEEAGPGPVAVIPADLSGEDWRLVADAETLELLIHEDPGRLSEEPDPELLLSLDVLELWEEEGGES